MVVVAKCSRVLAFHEMGRDCDWPASVRTIHRLACLADELLQELDDQEFYARRDACNLGRDDQAEQTPGLARMEASLRRLEQVEHLECQAHIYDQLAQAQRRVLAKLDNLGQSALAAGQAKPIPAGES